MGGGEGKLGMVRIPNYERAIIEPEKLKDYYYQIPIQLDDLKRRYFSKWVMQKQIGNNLRKTSGCNILPLRQVGRKDKIQAKAYNN
jgi:hypothetical protein